jgi:hypothetical protein
VLAGLDTATSGNVIMDGREVSGPSLDRGVVFQSHALMPWLTVRKNVEYGLRRKAMPQPERDRIVEHYLDEIGLTAFADLAAYLRAVRVLSPGSSPESAAIPLRRGELLSQCEQLLASLGWDAGRGRQFLEQHFQLASRQQLGDEQLLQFNMLLEEQLIGFGSAPAAAAPPG